MDQSSSYQAKVTALDNEELVNLYRSVKSDLSNGNPQRGDGTVDVAAIDDEMARRGLVPDREDVIPDQPASGADLDSPTKRVEDLPPGPGSASGDQGDDSPD